MILRMTLLTLIVAVTLICSWSLPAEASAVARVRSDSAIYAILLDALRGSGDSVLVSREFDEFPLFPDSMTDVPALAAAVHKRSPTFDSALVVALAEARYVGSVQTTLGHPRGVRWFRDLRDIGAHGDIPKYRFLTFSRVAYDASATHAVVYALMGCGGQCGNGSFYAFELRDGIWHKVGQVVRIVS